MTATTTPAPIGYRHPEVPWNGLTVTDLFCGAGGSSTGLVEAGYRCLHAANHWAKAVESHQLNHPETKHSQADISQVDPRYFAPTDVLWASPECTNHSIAKGVKRHQTQQQALFEMDGTRPQDDEAANRSRATMFDVPRFCEVHGYSAVIVENVVDAYRWVMFPAWLQAMDLLGYDHEIVWLNSMHAHEGGLAAPQSRDRMYIVLWRRDLTSRTNRKPNLAKWTSPPAFCPEHGEIRAVQTFKKAERWGRYRSQYLYRCPDCRQVVEPHFIGANTIIDWSLPAPRIGDRKKPLAEKTRERIRKGIERYWSPLVVEAAGNAYDSTDPWHRQYGDPDGYVRAWPAEQPLKTLHTTSSKGVAVPPEPLIVNLVSGADESRSRPVSRELPSIVAGGTHASLLEPEDAPQPDDDALLVPMRNHGVAKPVSQPIDTVAANGNHHALLMRNNRGGAEMSTPVTEPMRTLATRGAQSLIAPSHPVSVDVDDAGFRMLAPHEIQLGMGLPRDYQLVGTSRDKVKQAGNAVTPPAARVLGLAIAEFLNGGAR